MQLNCRILSNLQVLYGSDRLEPAASGVTELFHRNDDRRRLMHYRSIHAGLRVADADL